MSARSPVLQYSCSRGCTICSFPAWFGYNPIKPVIGDVAPLYPNRKNGPVLSNLRACLDDPNLLDGLPNHLIWGVRLTPAVSALLRTDSVSSSPK